MSWLRRLFGMDEGEGNEEELEKTLALEPSAKTPAEAKGNVTIVLSEPKNYEDGRRIADDLKSKKPVVVNLETLDHETARRCIDFLSGTIYALNGSVEKIAEAVFLFAPASVGVEENRRRSWEGNTKSLDDSFFSGL